MKITLAAALTWLGVLAGQPEATLPAGDDRAGPAAASASTNSAPAPTPVATVDGAAELAKLEWLVGRWTTVLKTANGPTSTIEVRYAWTGHRRAMRYVIHFCSGSDEVTQYEGMYYWHPGEKQIEMLQVDRQGNLTESVATVTTDRIQQRNLASHIDGTTQTQRVEVVHDSPDSFLIKALVQRDGAWVEAMRFRYQRAAEPVDWTPPRDRVIPRE